MWLDEYTEQLNGENNVIPTQQSKKSLSVCRIEGSQKLWKIWKICDWKKICVVIDLSTFRDGS